MHLSTAFTTSSWPVNPSTRVNEPLISPQRGIAIIIPVGFVYSDISIMILYENEKNVNFLLHLEILTWKRSELRGALTGHFHPRIFGHLWLCTITIGLGTTKSLWRRTGDCCTRQLFFWGGGRQWWGEMGEGCRFPRRSRKQMLFIDGNENSWDSCSFWLGFFLPGRCVWGSFEVMGIIPS